MSAINHGIHLVLNQLSYWSCWPHSVYLVVFYVGAMPSAVTSSDWMGTGNLKKHNGTSTKHRLEVALPKPTELTIYIYDFNLMSSLKSMEKLEHHFHSFPSFPTWEFSTLSPVAESGLRIPLGVPCWISRRAHRSPKIGTELIWLVVDLPLWKIWKSVGMMTFPTEWTHKIHVPNHQPVLEKKQLRVEFSTR